MEHFPQNSAEWSPKIKNILALLAVTTIPLHGMQESVQESWQLDHPVLAEMVQQGRVDGDCETALAPLFETIAVKEKTESAFAAVYRDDGSCEVLRLASGEQGEVRIQDEDVSRLEQGEGVVKVVFYHTHPYANAESGDTYSAGLKDRAHAGTIPGYSIDEPSEDDYMMMATEIKKVDDAGEAPSLIEQRVVTPMGVWKYGIMSPDKNVIAEKADETRKLGSLFGEVELAHARGESDDLLRKELDKIKPGYADVAFAAAALAKVDNHALSQESVVAYDRGDVAGVAAEFAQKLTAVNAYAISMQGIGYDVAFTPHPAVQRIMAGAAQ